MSGLTGNNILAGSSGQGGYEIEQSLRFDNGDYLSKTPSSASNRKTWTLSFWAKRSISTVDYQNVIMAGTAGVSSDRTYVRFNETADDSLLKIHNVGSFELYTSAVFRDPSAWYHVVVAVDTTEATASDRVKLWVNGVSQTLTGTTASLNDDTRINNTVPHYIGRSTYITGRHFDGYLAEFHLIDGQALTPSDFGETNEDTNQWIAKKYVGTYGTNGFYLNFSNSASLGADSSGNGNNFTPTNLAATDQVLDSPTNNFCTLNPLSVSPAFALTAGTNLSEGNLRETGSNVEAHGTFGVTSGKWYFELCNTGGGYNNDAVGYFKEGTSYELVYRDTGVFYSNGSSSSYGQTWQTVGDIVGVALDLDAGTLDFYKNNVSQGTAVTGLTDGATYVPMVYARDGNATSDLIANFGQDSSFAGTKTAQNNTDGNGKGDFYYAPPSGYLALCEDNLSDPSIALPGEHFNTVLYTGLYGTSDSYTGVGFQPDFTWLKHRNNPTAYGHQLYDVVRGATNYLISNTSGAENDGGGPFTAGLQSFDSDGFTIGQTLTINASGVNHVAWNWKADNTSGSSNTDGTITSTVSANTTAGFSIVSYTGNATAGATVGHGLSQAPEFMLIKQRDATKNWSVFANDPTDYLILNGSNASADDNRFWNDTSPGSSVFTLGSIDWVNATGNTYIAYCFHSVEGYSKFGTYIGNGANNGPFVYTGFSPAFLIVKEINTGVQNWYMMDNKRGTNNPVNQYLYPNQPSAENGYAQGDFFDIVDFVSNGFKIKHSRPALNQSGNTLIYMAFAESPFKYSNAR